MATHFTARESRFETLENASGPKLQTETLCDSGPALPWRAIALKLEGMSDAAPERAFFDATLSPYRSLPQRGFFWVMAVLAGGSFCAGVGCVLAGAWPVTGFFGLDVALVYLAFRLSYRSARQTETVRLTDRALDVERISIRGERRRWRFEPFWLRIIFEEWEEGQNRLLLASHGRSLALGTFLSSPERRNLALELKAALEAWRRALRQRDE
jgi:uncharacterized membrane protein